MAGQELELITRNIFRGNEPQIPTFQFLNGEHPTREQLVAALVAASDLLVRRIDRINNRTLIELNARWHPPQLDRDVLTGASAWVLKILLITCWGDILDARRMMGENW